MRRILFVDDEPGILEGLRRSLRCMRHDWRMEFETSGAAGLEAMKREPFDVVVSDMKMPGMDGAEFLSEVKRVHPASIRIILSGHSERTSIMKSVGPTHQYLAKPCEPERLQRAIRRAQELRELLQDESLTRLAGQIDTLPSLPSLYQELVAELHRPHASLAAVAQVIERDIGMSAKLLKLVNSAYFGLRSDVTSVQRAIHLLGLETITTLVLSAHVFEAYEEGDPAGLSIETLWEHSLATSACCRAIAASEGLDRRLADDALTAGMLHDVGKLILATRRTRDYREVLRLTEESGRGVSVAETEIFGATHAQIGAYLVGLWGLPDAVVEAIAFHAVPSRCLEQGMSTVTVVHVASALAAELGRGRGVQADNLDHDYLAASGLAARLEDWREACREAVEREGS